VSFHSCRPDERSVKSEGQALIIAGITLSINTWDQNLFWKGLADFHNMASYFVDNGIYVWYALPSGSLSLQPIAGPNMNKAKLEAVSILAVPLPPLLFTPSRS